MKNLNEHELQMIISCVDEKIERLEFIQSSNEYRDYETFLELNQLRVVSYKLNGKWGDLP